MDRDRRSAWNQGQKVANPRNEVRRNGSDIPNGFPKGTDEIASEIGNRRLNTGVAKNTNTACRLRPMKVKQPSCQAEDDKGYSQQGGTDSGSDFAASVQPPNCKTLSFRIPIGFVWAG